MHVIRTPRGDVCLPLPPNWTVTETPSATINHLDVTIEGTSPDTDLVRNTAVKVVLDLDLEVGRIHRTCRISVRSEVERHRWDDAANQYKATGTWRKAGRGGWRVTAFVLQSLIEGGRSI